MKLAGSLATIAASVGVAAVVAWAGSWSGASVAGLPVFALCAGLAFAINWIVFVPCYAAATERYYDLTGSLTYLSLVGFALLSGAGDARADFAATFYAAPSLRFDALAHKPER